MSEAKNARRRERYATDAEFREWKKAKSRAWKETHRDYIHERDRKGRERMREALGRPERYCMPWTKDEDEHLKSMIGMRREEIAETLKRTERAVKNRAEFFGLGWDGFRLVDRPRERRLNDDSVTMELRQRAKGRAFYGNL